MPHKEPVVLVNREWKLVGRSKSGKWAHDIIQLMKQVEQEMDNELVQQELFNGNKNNHA